MYPQVSVTLGGAAEVEWLGAIGGAIQLTRHSSGLLVQASRVAKFIKVAACCRDTVLIINEAVLQEKRLVLG